MALTDISCRLALGAVLVVGMVTTAQADNVPITRQVTKILTYTDWAAVFYEPAYSNNVGCAGAPSDSVAVIEWRSDPDRKAMYAALLAAYVAEEQVGFGISGCWSFFGGGVPLIYRVDMAGE